MKYLIPTVLSLFPFFVSAQSVDEQEQKLFEMLNKHRADNGLGALKSSNMLTLAAEKNVDNRLTKNYVLVRASKFGYEGKTKETTWRLGSGTMNAERAIGKFKANSTYTDYKSVVLELDKYAGSDWNAIGICMKETYISVWFGTTASAGDEWNAATAETPKGPKSYNSVFNWAIEPQFNKVRSFSEGYAPVSDGYNWSVIDKKGKKVIEGQFRWPGKFSDGLIAMKNTTHYGFYNSKGALVIPHKYKSVQPFVNGAAIVSEGEYNYLIDKQGNTISKSYSDMGHIGPDLIGFQNGKYGIMNSKGEVLLKPTYSDFFHFSDGVFGVKINGKWGFVDKDFKTVIEPKYTQKLVYSFNYGFAAVPVNGKKIYIDKQGKKLGTGSYDEAYEFTGDGLAAVSQWGKWGYIDKTGKLVIEYKFDAAYNFMNGYARVLSKGNYGFIDTKGNFVIEPTLSNAQDFYDGVAAIQVGGSWGYIVKK